MGNVMWHHVDGKVHGVLNDYDLASFEEDKDKGPSSNHRTGTKPYMAFDLLDEYWKGGHFYRHDLESLFYIILCIACRYRYPGVPAQDPRKYEEWFTGSERQVYLEKTSFILNPTFSSFPVQPYFENFLPWLKNIYGMLVAGHRHRPSLLLHELGEEINEDFNWSTLNGKFSYRRLNQVMATFNGTSLEPRWTAGPRNADN
jgi:hypothetical protein